MRTVVLALVLAVVALTHGCAARGPEQGQARPVAPAIRSVE